MSIAFREFDLDSDLDGAARLWKEAGWLSGGERDISGMRDWLAGCRGIGATVDGELDGLATRRAGQLRYETGDVPLSLVASVNVSGTYVVELAERSSARLDRDASLPALRASVGRPPTPSVDWDL